MRAVRQAKSASAPPMKAANRNRMKMPRRGSTAKACTEVRTPERDADREERPRDRRPGPRPARPGRIEAARKERRYRKGEGHRETDIAHVEHRRMQDHAGVLQERVEVAAVCRGRQEAVEGIG